MNNKWKSHRLLIVRCIFLSVLFFYGIVFWNSFIQYRELNQSFTDYFLILNIALLISMLFHVLIYFAVIKYLKIDIKQIQDDTNEEWNNRFRAYKHETNNHWQVVLAMIELDYKEKVVAYIRKLAHENGRLKESETYNSDEQKEALKKYRL